LKYKTELIKGIKYSRVKMKKKFADL